MGGPHTLRTRRNYRLAAEIECYHALARFTDFFQDGVLKDGKTA